MTQSVQFRHAVRGQVLQRVWMATLETKSETIRVFQGAGYIDVPGYGRFSGLGEFGQISSLKQAVSGQAPAMSLALSGIPEWVVRKARDAPEQAKGRPARIHMAVWNAQTLEYVGLITPVTAIMDRVTFSMSSEYSEDGGSFRRYDVSVSLESVFGSRRTKASLATYTDVDQQRRYPGDLGCEFVNNIGAKTYQWPIL